jgi:excinuclease ABC subunit A
MKKITELCDMDISDLTTWFKDLDSHLSDKQKRIATEVIKEIKDRLNFFDECRFELFGFKPKLKSLSGGEAQRIRLATQIGSPVGCFIYFDEPVLVYTKEIMKN